MPDDISQSNSPQAATALAEPPAPPHPPGTATAAPPPGPRRRRWIGWTVGLLCAALAVGTLVWVVMWSTRRSAATTDFSAYRPGFESALKKAGTAATFPKEAVELESVTASGSHSFEATFTAEEISALVNVFPWTTEIQGTSVAVSGARVGFPSRGNGSLRARVKLNGSSYSGTIEAPIEFRMGEITSPGATRVVAEGISVKGEQAAQATEMLLVYLNAYLKAAPGLSVYSAEVTDSGVHVRGSAPDTLAYP